MFFLPLSYPHLGESQSIQDGSLNPQQGRAHSAASEILAREQPCCFLRLDLWGPHFICCCFPKLSNGHEDNFSPIILRALLPITPLMFGQLTSYPRKDGYANCRASSEAHF